MTLQVRMRLATDLSVPSPLVGEGQGGGWPQAITSRLLAGAAALRGIRNRGRRDSRLPTSPTLPHKGGGSNKQWGFA
jgi:hypothetical protein